MRFVRSKKFIIFCFLTILISIIYLSGVLDMLTLENLRENAYNLKEFTSENYLSSVLIFISIYILTIVFSLPGAIVLTLASGYFFGFLGGAIYAWLGAVIGSVLSFLLSRYLLGNYIQKRYGKRLLKFNEELKRNGSNYLLILRLIPVVPFFFINLLSGISKVSFRNFFLTTALGIIPGGLVYTYSGDQLDRVNKLEDILSPQILAALIFMALIAVFPVIYRKVWER